MFKVPHSLLEVILSYRCAEPSCLSFHPCLLWSAQPVLASTSSVLSESPAVDRGCPSCLPFHPESHVFTFAQVFLQNFRVTCSTLCVSIGMVQDHLSSCPNSMLACLSRMCSPNPSLRAHGQRALTAWSCFDKSFPSGPMVK